MGKNIYKLQSFGLVYFILWHRFQCAQQLAVVCWVNRKQQIDVFGHACKTMQRHRSTTNHDVLHVKISQCLRQTEQIGLVGLPGCNHDGCNL